MNTRINLGRRPWTHQSSLRTAITGGIRWGTTSVSSQKRAAILALFAMASTVAWTAMSTNIYVCNSSVIMQIAKRSSTRPSTQCLVFNKECDCRISPNETLSVDRCAPHLKSFAMRVIPVVSSVLELSIFRELITLGTSSNRFFDQVGWMMFPLVSIAIAIAMFSTHCYHLAFGLIIFVTSGVLAMLVFHDCTENKMVANERRRANAMRWAPPLELIDDDTNSWKQIL